MARWVRPVVLVLLIAAAVVVALKVGAPPLAEIRSWVRSAGWAGPVLYAGIFAVVALTPGPATVMTVGAGVLFGWPIGFPVAVAGALTAAVGGFTLARVLGRSTVQGLGGDRLARLDAVLRRRGLLAVIGIRWLPLAPFAVVNATCGLTGVRVRDYVLGTAIGLLPGSATYVAVGAFGATPGSGPFLFAIGGLAVLVVGTAVAARREVLATLLAPADSPSTAPDEPAAADRATLSTISGDHPDDPSSDH